MIHFYLIKDNKLNPAGRMAESTFKNMLAGFKPGVNYCAIKDSEIFEQGITK